jgi:hypothetical protein
MSRLSILISILIIVVFAAILFLMGRVPICECGYVKFWHGPTALTSENSQHISDWYTFSHIIHGFGFYWFAWLLGKRFGRQDESGRRSFSVGTMLILAVIAETSWEIFENTDLIINRYRSITISYDYYGDSIINSVGDVLFMVLGFFMAWRLPVWSIIVLAIGMELFVGYYIRDNLTLNIIMLIYPFEAILKWQGGG